MKNSILIFILSLILVSCLPEKRLERLKTRICPLCVDSVSTTQTITYRDTVVLSDTVLQFMDSGGEIIFDSKQCDFSPKIIKTSNWTATISITEGKLSCVVSNIRAKLSTHHDLKVITVEKKKYYPVYKDRPVEYIPHAYLVSSWILWVVGAGGIAYLIFSNLSQNLWYGVGVLLYKFVALFKSRKK